MFMLVIVPIIISCFALIVSCYVAYRQLDHSSERNFKVDATVEKENENKECDVSVRVKADVEIF